MGGGVVGRVGGVIFSFNKIIVNLSHRRTMGTFRQVKIERTSDLLKGCRRRKVFRRMRGKGVSTRAFHYRLDGVYKGRLACRSIRGK